MAVGAIFRCGDNLHKVGEMEHQAGDQSLSKTRTVLVSNKTKTRGNICWDQVTLDGIIMMLWSQN